MPQMRIREAAVYLGVSDDTVRRWIEQGSLAASTDGSGRRAVDGYEVALLAREHASSLPLPAGVVSSARNRMAGIVTGVRSDPVMSQVELQCGPFRVVSLMSTEAVQELGLEPGSVAVAAIKATNVVVEAVSPTAAGR